MCGIPQVGRSARIVEDLGERSGDDGALDPALEALQILLRQDSLARGVWHRDAPNTKRSQEGSRFPLRLPFGASVIATLPVVLLRELGLVHVALHLRLQGPPGRLVQGVYHQVVVEARAVVFEAL